MAATIDIACPKCKKEIKAPAEVRGKKIRCKSCSEIFTVPAAPAKAPAAGKAPAGAKQAAGAVSGKSAKAPPPPAAKPIDDDEIEAYGVADPDKAYAPPPTSAKTDNTPRPRAMHPDDELAKNPYGVTDLDLTPRCPQCAEELDGEDAVICLKCGYNCLTREMGKTVRSYAHTPMERIMWLMPGILLSVVVLLMVGWIAFLWLLMLKMAEKNPEAWWTFFAGFPLQVWGSIIAAGIGWICLKFAIKRLIKNPVPPEKLKSK